MPEAKDETKNRGRRTPTTVPPGTLVPPTPKVKKTDAQQLRALLQELFWDLFCRFCSLAIHQMTHYAIPLFILYVMWLIIARLLIV